MIFISYSSEDVEQANAVKKVLEANNFECWMAPESIPSGSDYASEIPAAIEKCTTFLLMLSDRSQGSTWVPKELDLAINSSKLIVPFHLDQSLLRAPFNFYLTNVQRIEAYNQLEKGYLELIEQLRRAENMTEPGTPKIDLREEKTVFGAAEEFATEIDERNLPEEFKNDIKLNAAGISVPYGVNKDGTIAKYSFTEEGHLSIWGESKSGKSTLLQTILWGLIRDYTPDLVQIYGLDFNNGAMESIESAPNVCNIFYEEDVNSLEKLKFAINQIMAERKKQFRRFSYAQYLEDGNMDVSAIFLCIDGVEKLRTVTSDLDDWLLTLATEGDRFGIYLILTDYKAGARGISSRVRERIHGKICLSQRDFYDYVDIMESHNFRVAADKKLAGWGISYQQGQIIEFISVPAFGVKSEIRRFDKIEDFCVMQKAAWKGKTPRKLHRMSDEFSWKDYIDFPGIEEAIETKRTFPIGVEQISEAPVVLDLKSIFCYLISGTMHSGKTGMLSSLIRMAYEKKRRGVYDIAPKIVIIENRGVSLRAIAEQYEIECLNSQNEIYDFWAELVPVYKERNVLKKELIAQGAHGSEIFDAMQRYPMYFIFIADLGKFIREARTQTETPGYDVFLENVFDKGANHGFYFFGAMDEMDQASVDTDRLFQLFVNARQGVRLGGKLASEKNLLFNNISFREQNVVDPVGAFRTGETADKPSCKGYFPKV